MRVRRHSSYRSVDLRRVDQDADDFTLSEENVPESRPHDLVIDLLKAQLVAWVARAGRRAQVGRNLAIRWDPERPQFGVDPDVYVVEPPPPEGDEVTSLLLWESGHFPPLLAVEVVSARSQRKDYTRAPEKYALAGVGELWVFDPKHAAPPSLGPYRLQIWRRDEAGGERFERVYAGEGPAYSPAVNAWLFAVDEGQKLRIADDEAGTHWWMTTEESERAAKEQALAAKEQALAAKEQALAAKEQALTALESERSERERAERRIAELEAKLTRRARGEPR